MSQRTVVEDEIDSYFEALNNWGRWGTNDDAGTLNLLTPERIIDATRLIQRGRTVSCARTLNLNEPNGSGQGHQGQHFMIKTGEGAPDRGRWSTNDWVGYACHGFDNTHLDSHAHALWNGMMYNGRRATLCTSLDGAMAGDLTPAFSGIFGRGIFVDGAELRHREWLSPGDAITPSDLDSWYQSHDVLSKAGDLLLVSTGRHASEQAGHSLDPQLGVAGLSPTCLPWLRQHDVAVLITDVIADAMPAPTSAEGSHRPQTPIHSVGIAGMGLWVIDNAQLGALKAACAEEGTVEFFIGISPPALERVTGSLVNPVAIF
jgi:hypothetical protein